VERLDSRKRCGKGLCAGDIDCAGLKQGDHALELLKILGHQRIGRRDRRNGHAGMHGAKREQRVIDAVVGKNDKRMVGAQPLRQRPGGDGAHLLERLAIGHRRPRYVARALAEEDAIGRGPGPMLQPVADAARGRLQRRGRPHDGAAIGAALGDDGGNGEQADGIVASDSGHRHGFLPCLDHSLVVGGLFQ
jgi:hypothetical protein